MMSALPPGEYGTIIRNGRDGYSADCAGADSAAKESEGYVRHEAAPVQRRLTTKRQVAHSGRMPESVITRAHFESCRECERRNL